MLSRFLIRERVNLLVAVPLAVTLLMTVPFIADRLQSIRSAHIASDATVTLGTVGRLVDALGRERALSVACALTPDCRATSVLEQQATVADSVGEVRHLAAGQLPPALGQALDALGHLDAIRAQLRAHHATPQTIEDAYDAATDGLVNAVGPGTVLGQAPGTSTFLALNALLSGNEQADRAAVHAMALLLDPSLPPAQRQREVAAQTVAQQVAQQQTALFRSLIDAGHRALFEAMARGGAATDVDQLLKQSLAPATATPHAGDTASLASRVYAVVETAAQLRQLVAEKIVRDLTEQATRSAASAQAAGIAFAAVSVALFVLTLTLSLAIGRSVTQPLRRLTTAAGRVADLAHTELTQVADDESGAVVLPRLAAIDIDSHDEIGDLARVVNQIQAAAVLLLERQLAGRSTMAAMLRSIGRRTQGLVNRQTAVIDTLERDEHDPDVLARLYSLDHLTARLRRHADSLLVLSGAREPALHARAVPLAVLIRSAFGGVQDFQRIELSSVHDLQVSAQLADDLMLLIAELLDNATRYSPPHTTVTVQAEKTDTGCTVTIADQGVGMPPERVLEENRRLVTRERLDLIPTDVLGLFVVGRLCRRHGLNASLHPGAEGGLSAVVQIPHKYLAPDAATDEPPQPGSPEPALLEDPPGIAARVRASLERIAQWDEHPPVAGFAWFDPSGADRRPHLPAVALVTPLPAPTPRPLAPHNAQGRPASAAGLERRVPGANLRAADPAPNLMPVRAQAIDAVALRATLEEFEAAVERGRNAPGHH